MPTNESHPLAWVRAFIGPTFIIGGWQLMSVSFTAGACIVYVGFLLCLAEIIWERELLRRHTAIQVILIGVLGVFFDLFTIEVVLIPAPLAFNSTWTEPRHVVASTGGISWSPFFGELEIAFTNPQTNATYDDFNALVKPDRPVAGISQLSNLFDVSFEDRYALSLHAWIEGVEDFANNRNLEFIATNAGYKVHCAHIPPNASLRIVMATVELKTAQPKPPVLQPVLPESIFVVPTFKDKDGSESSYWFGSRGYLGRFLPPTSPTKIAVNGSYMGNHRLRRIKEDVTVGIVTVFQ